MGSMKKISWIKTGIMVPIILLVFGIWTSYPSFASSAPISIDGDSSDWGIIDGRNGSGEELSGLLRAANDERYLYISYQGDWASNVNMEVEIQINEEDLISPYSPVLLNFMPERELGSFGLQDGWYESLSGAAGSYQTTLNVEALSPESLFFEARIPLSSLGYTDDWSPVIEVTWSSLGGRRITAEGYGETQPPPEEDVDAEGEELTEAGEGSPETTQEAVEGPVEVPIDESDEEAVVGPNEEESSSMEEPLEDNPLDDEEPLEEEEELTPEAIEDSPGALSEEFLISEEALQMELNLLAIGDYLEIDGYYSDWAGVTHTDIYWNTRNIHQGAMVLQDDRIYVHLKESDTLNRMLETGAMHFYINDNILYDGQGYPTEDTSMMVALANVGPGNTMESFLDNLKDPGIYDGLGAFEYDGWPKRYLGEAAFTVYDKKHNPGDECEFYMELSEIADYFGVNENEIYTITAYFPRLGSQVMTVTGVSTGPVLGAIMIVGMAATGMVLHRKRRKKEDEE